MIIYEALYNPCIHESGCVTISVHKTLKGAYNAMKIHRMVEWEQYLGFSKKYRNRIKFGEHKWWGVGRIKLEE